MKRFLMILFFLIFYLIQSVFFSARVHPDFILILIVCIGLYEDSKEAVILALLAAVTGGLFSPSLLFFYMMSFTVIVFLITIIKEKIFYENIFLPLFLCAVFTVFNDFMFYGFSLLHKNMQFFIFGNIIYRILLNSAFIVPLYYLYGYFFVKSEKIKL